VLFNYKRARKIDLGDTVHIFHCVGIEDQIEISVLESLAHKDTLRVNYYFGTNNCSYRYKRAKIRHDTFALFSVKSSRLRSQKIHANVLQESNN
jgi:hypothetical protein